MPAMGDGGVGGGRVTTTGGPQLATSGLGIAAGSSEAALEVEEAMALDRLQQERASQQEAFAEK